MADNSLTIEMGAIALPSPAIPQADSKPKSPGIAERIIKKNEIAARAAIDKLKLESLRSGFARESIYPDGSKERMTQLAMRLPDGTKVSVVTDEKENLGRLNGRITTVLELKKGSPRILILHQPTDPIELRNLERDIEFWDLSVNEDQPLPVNASSEFVSLLKEAIPDIPATNEYMQRNLEMNGGKNENVRNHTEVKIGLARDMLVSKV